MGRQKEIIVLGATGSIGTQAADVVRKHPHDFRIVAVSALTSETECGKLAAEFGARPYVGEGAALRAVEENRADVCLVATVGLSGLAPTLTAIGKGMDVALATKEVMVMAGELVMRRAMTAGVRVLPVDSEHSAIFQCLNGERREDVSRLVLTASGGPFLDSPRDLSKVTVAQALNHPRWKMGPKVTVDSATMMNKGFEVIEARWLFGIDESRIDVVVHPESVVHSLVTFCDGSTKAQLAPPDMRLAIQYALSHPDRIADDRKALDLSALGSLTFRAPDAARFPAIGLAREALRTGGCAPVVAATADEWAVKRFVGGEIGFADIVPLVERCLEKAPHEKCETVEAVEAAARWTEGFVKTLS